MKRSLCFLVCLFLLAGCGGKAVPQWVKTSHAQLDHFKNHYLQGRDRQAETSFHAAVEAIKFSGDLHLLQVAYLTRYAVNRAALEDFDDLEYRRLADVAPHAGNAHFHAFLKGSFDRVDEQALPPQYRPFLRACRSANPSQADQAIFAIEDPLSRLIASGLALQAQCYQEKTINEAIRTASEQGWKRALLAYLKKLQAFYAARGDRAGAEFTRRKMDLIR